MQVGLGACVLRAWHPTTACVHRELYPTRKYTMDTVLASDASQVWCGVVPPPSPSACTPTGPRVLHRRQTRR